MISNLAKTLEEMEQKAEKRGIEEGEKRGEMELTGLSREEVEKMKEKND
ncbi:MAG: hypothetical protein NTX88_04435 [Candidatus Atribacteria bacterium]|nr:hypothetical protein [Candidatus Atribacteria bacterium]